MPVIYQIFLCRILLLINVLTVGVIFRVRDYPAPEADFQTYMKIAVWLSSLLFCIFFYRQCCAKMFRADNLFMTIFLAFCALSVVYAPLVYFSTGAVFTVCAVFVFCFTASSILSNREFFITCFYGFSLICIMSLIAYFVIPEFARYREWHNGILTVGTRLCGVTGTANHMGFISAFALLIAFRIYKENYLRPGVFFIVLVGIDLLCLVMTNSRTSLAALLISIYAASFLFPTYQKLAFSTLGMALVLAMLTFGETDEVFAAISRSGDASEITTGTGRSDIWRVVLKLIQESPFLGYGYASSLQILDAATQEVGFKAASTHNIALQILLSTGVFSFIIFILALLFKTYTSIMNKDSFILSGIIFILIIGISESVAFQGTANTSTLALALIFAARYSREKEEF